MKICILAFAHSILGTRVYYREALTLRRAGHDVMIIGRDPGGQLAREGMSDGVRFRAYPARSLSRLRQALSDPVMLFRFLRDGWREDADVYHCHEPQSLLVGTILARSRGVGLVYDCHEYQPESYADHFGPALYPLAKRLFRILERLSIRLVDCVVTVNEHLGGRFCPDCDHVVVLPNYPVLKMFEDIESPPAELRARYAGKKVLMYVGGMGEARGVTACLHVMAHLHTLVPEARMLFIGRLSGDYAQQVKALINELGLEDVVEFLGRVEYHAIPGCLQLGDLGVFLVQPGRERYAWAEPIKYFEYSACGLPVVMSDLLAPRRLIVEEVDNGIVVDPQDYIGTAKAIAELLGDEPRRQAMARRGREAFLSRLNWRAVEGRLISAYEQLGTEIESRSG